MKFDFDVVVVGAGIIGQTLALGLGKQGFKVAVVDNAGEPKVSEKPSPKVFSNRVSAISYSSQQLFEQLDVWANINRKQEYCDMEVSDQQGFGRIHFNRQELLDLLLASNSDSSPSLGHIIENNEINKALYKRISAFENIKCFFNASIIQLTTDNNSAQVTFIENSLRATGNESSDNVASLETNPTIICARLLVGADGANSKVREHFALKHTFYDYDHTAIVCNVKTEHEHQGLAKQVFTPYGPLAFLPLANPHQCSIVFSQQSQRALELNNLSDIEFAKLLQVTIDNRYGKCELVTQRVSFPLRMRYARNWTLPNVALMGDAAHTIHPLAGQGANLGLGDVKTLLDLIEQEPTKLGSIYQLRKYERHRKSEALKVIATMQGFKTLFDGNNLIKRVVRNAGLAVVHNASPLKSFFIKQAIG